MQGARQGAQRRNGDGSTCWWLRNRDAGHGCRRWDVPNLGPRCTGKGWRDWCDDGGARGRDKVLRPAR